MLSDVLNIIVSLPSQHVIFGIISTVLCIAVAWVYSSSSEKNKKSHPGDDWISSCFQRISISSKYVLLWILVLRNISSIRDVLHICFIDSCL